MHNELTQNRLLTAFVLHYDGLVDYVRRHFGSHGFASDVVHDVCIQLMENPPGYEVTAPLAFFRKATVNRAIDRTRNEQIRRRHHDTVHRQDEEHYLDGAYAMEFAEKMHAMKRIIDQLPTKQRQVFLLHQLHGLPKSDIAARMMISINMVNKHFNKATTSILLAWQHYAS